MSAGSLPQLSGVPVPTNAGRPLADTQPLSGSVGQRLPAAALVNVAREPPVITAYIPPGQLKLRIEAALRSGLEAIKAAYGDDGFSVPDGARVVYVDQAAKPSDPIAWVEPDKPGVITVASNHPVWREFSTGPGTVRAVIWHELLHVSSERFIEAVAAAHIAQSDVGGLGSFKSGTPVVTQLADVLIEGLTEVLKDRILVHGIVGKDTQDSYPEEAKWAQKLYDLDPQRVERLFFGPATAADIEWAVQHLKRFAASEAIDLGLLPPPIDLRHPPSAGSLEVAEAFERLSAEYILGVHSPLLAGVVAVLTQRHGSAEALRNNQPDDFLKIEQAVETVLSEARSRQSRP